MQLLLTTTGTQSPVIIIDLGAKSFTHPVTDFNLLTEFDLELLRDSSNLQTAITNGYVTLKDESGVSISDLSKLFPRPDTTVVRNNIISPAQITSNQNDYNPTGLSTCDVMRLYSDSARDITGISAQPSGTLIHIFNIGVGGASIKLKKENASSSAANRFFIPADITVATDESCIIWYDGISSRWRVAAGKF